MPLPARNYILSCCPPQVTANNRWPPHLKTLGLSRYQSAGCQLEAVHHYCQSVKKIMGLVMQNNDLDSNSILEKKKLRFRSLY